MYLRRHPIRGFFGGLLIGLGLSILLVIYGTAPLGPATVLVLVILFAALGVAAAWVLPARSRPVVATQPAIDQTATTTTTTSAYPPDERARDRDDAYRP